MSLPRFYIPPIEWDPEHPVLPKDEARHCRDVLRCRPGENIIIFNGIGEQLECEIAACSAQAVDLTPQQLLTSPKPRTRVTLAPAIPKGKNMEWIIQKSTELGVAEIVPLITSRTVVKVSNRDITRKQEKWQRVALEASKQCGQNWLPSVSPPVDFISLCNENRDSLQLIAALSGTASPLKTILAERSEPKSVLLTVGPEGDFTDEELRHALQSGFRALSLGQLVLRAETASIYGMSILSHELSEL